MNLGGQLNSPPTMAPVLLFLSESSSLLLETTPVWVGVDKVDREVDKVGGRVLVFVVLLTVFIVVSGLGVASGLPIPRKGLVKNALKGVKRNETDGRQR